MSPVKRVFLEKEELIKNYSDNINYLQNEIKNIEDENLEIKKKLYENSVFYKINLIHFFKTFQKEFK